MVNIGVSIGINTISKADLNREELTQKADLAMYAAKASGKNTFSFYTPEMLDVVNERWEIEQGLKRALAANEFRAYYQPIVNCSGELLGMECLLRWDHPERGILPPAKFLSIAEESSLIVPIGVWVLNQACDDIARWNAQGLKDLYVSVNFHSKQFEEPDVVETIESALRRSGVQAGNLKIELTETGIMLNPEGTIEVMKQIKNRLPGIRIMVDDFGTGYSSLNYLANLPSDTLKIDLSFVSKLSDQNNEKVIPSIIKLAESLHMDYIVEGIETQTYLDYFSRRSCPAMQGYFFSRPQPSTRWDQVFAQPDSTSLPWRS